jgi:hypothetical protein
MDTRHDSPRRPSFSRSAWSKPLVLVALSVAALVVAPPASASDPQLSVAPANGLDPAGAFVVVSGSGYLPGAQLFVMQCRSTSTDDHVCNSVGLRKVTTDANGSFTANAMRVVGRFGATDCTVDACSIMTSAVSGHSDDRSQDRAAPIGFAAPPPPPPVTEAPVVPVAPPTTATPVAPSSEPVAPSTAPAPADGSTSSTVSTSTTTTTADVLSASAERAAEDGPAADGPDGAERDEVALSSGADVGERGGDGSSMPLVVGVLALLAAIGVGGAFALRRRTPAAA